MFIVHKVPLLLFLGICSISSSFPCTCNGLETSAADYTWRRGMILGNGAHILSLTKHANASPFVWMSLPPVQSRQLWCAPTASRRRPRRARVSSAAEDRERGERERTGRGDAKRVYWKRRGWGCQAKVGDVFCQCNYAAAVRDVIFKASLGGHSFRNKYKQYEERNIFTK